MDPNMLPVCALAMLGEQDYACWIHVYFSSTALIIIDFKRHTAERHLVEMGHEKYY